MRIVVGGTVCVADTVVWKMVCVEDTVVRGIVGVADTVIGGVIVGVTGTVVRWIVGVGVTRGNSTSPERRPKFWSGVIVTFTGVSRVRMFD